MKKQVVLFIFILMSSLYSFAQLDSNGNTFVQEKISIAGIEKGKIEKTKLISSKGLEFLNKAFAGYKITGYRLTLVLKGQGLLEFSNNNGELAPEMKEAIEEAPAGTKLFFEFIRCLDPDGHSLPVLPTGFVLK